jgi:aminoglycoside phosphotransferase family enzyme
MHADKRPLDSKATSLETKVAFLKNPAAYPFPVRDIITRETHMSFVFLAGDKAFKLKKPVRFPYLDFSTLSRREMACRAELALNRRLASDVYLDVVALTRSNDGLAIGGPGEIIDWLIVMRRLDENETLENAILTEKLTRGNLDQLMTTLAGFYRRARAIFISPNIHVWNWRVSLALNTRVLLNPDLGLPAGLVRRIDRAQRQFLSQRSGLIAQRVRSRHVVDGHGDLRPEHIWLLDSMRIIDCLEFNPTFRAVDPLDEIAFLSVECERLGSVWVGQYIKRLAIQAFGDGESEELFTFYRCYRATLRARLAIAHMLEPNPRTPEKWPRQARSYLQIGAEDARRLERITRKRKSPSSQRAGAARRREEESLLKTPSYRRALGLHGDA